MTTDATKSTSERVKECIRLRTQWAEYFSPSEFPDDLVKEMNAFVAGAPSTGKFLYRDPRDQRDKTLHYQFATHKSKKTFIRIGSSWI